MKWNNNSGTRSKKIKINKNIDDSDRAKLITIIIVGNLTTIKMIMMITTTIIISQGEINIQ